MICLNFWPAFSTAFAFHRGLAFRRVAFRGFLDGGEASRAFKSTYRAISLSANVRFRPKADI